MCLSNVDLKTTKKLRTNTKPIVCWKVVEIRDKKYYSIYYRSTTWNVNKTFVSTRTTLSQTSYEKTWNEIQHGVHAFTTRKIAREYLKYKKNFNSGTKYCILKLIGLPKNLVGIGTFGFNNNYKQNSIVFTKVFVEKVSR